MHSKSFLLLCEEVSTALQSLKGVKQDGKLEKRAQQIVDEIFKKHKARRKPVIIEEAGIEIVGCVLGFDVGTIGIGCWLTNFYPHDRHDVLKTEPTVIPLGYVNGYQLYLSPKSGTLVARHGMGHQFASWKPKVQGMPSTDSIFYVALERAKNLGYLSLLQD